MNGKPLSVAEHKSKYSKQLKNYSDPEIVEAINGQVRKPGWGAARQAYLWALREELINRNIDVSEILGDHGISFSKRVKLVQKKLYPID